MKTIKQRNQFWVIHYEYMNMCLWCLFMYVCMCVRWYWILQWTLHARTYNSIWFVWWCSCVCVSIEFVCAIDIATLDSSIFKLNVYMHIRAPMCVCVCALCMKCWNFMFSNPIQMHWWQWAEWVVTSIYSMIQSTQHYWILFTYVCYACLSHSLAVSVYISYVFVYMCAIELIGNYSKAEHQHQHHK